MLRTISHAIEFPFHAYSGMAFSDPALVHIDSDRNLLKLRPVKGKYSTTANIKARPPVFEARAMTRLLGFDLSFSAPEEDVGAATTGVGLRLFDGTSEKYWNGTGWVTAGSGNWNTLAEVQAHLGTFPLGASRLLAPVFNLWTKDPRYTPEVSRAVFLFSAEVPSFEELWVLRTLVPRMKEIRPEADLVAGWKTSGVSFDLNELEFEESLGEGLDGITLVFGLWDLTADPGRSNNLASAFNPSTKILTASASITEGHEVLIRVGYTPVVAVLTHPDYNELSGVPCISVASVVETTSGDSPVQETTIARMTGAGRGVRLRQVDYLISLRATASRLVDLLRLTSALRTNFLRLPVLQCKEVGAFADLWVSEGLNQTASAGKGHLQEAGLIVRISHAKVWDYEETQGTGVVRTVVSLQED